MAVRRRRAPVRVVGSCKECPVGSTRPVTRPGPRCATHQRERKARLRSVNHAKWILATYGITADEYWSIYQEQGGVCFICRRAKGKDETGSGRGKMLSVDHNHKTGEVRGLCCGPCNRDVLGHLRDDVEAFKRCIEYLTNPPARRVLARLRGVNGQPNTALPAGVKPTTTGGGDTETPST